MAHSRIPDPTTGNAVYNAANELTNWNGATLSYDANGNMTSEGTNTYTWDTRNQLTSIAGNFTAGFEYDPFGRRLGKTINGKTTNFLYDGANPIQELSGTTVTANLLTGFGIDEYLTRTDATGTSDFLTDALGSTIALADSTGTVQTQYTYDPFGGTTVQGASNANSYEFTGRENDGQGLYYYRARYYSPMFLRFASQDPIGHLAGPDPYLYTYNDPFGYVDPTGLWPWWLSHLPWNYYKVQTGQDATQADWEIYQMTSPFLFNMATCPWAPQLAAVNNLEQINLVIDAGVSGPSLVSLVDADPILEKACELGNQLAPSRNQINQQIANILKQVNKEIRQAMKQDPCGYDKGCK